MIYTSRVALFNELSKKFNYCDIKFACDLIALVKAD